MGTSGQYIEQVRMSRNARDENRNDHQGRQAMDQPRAQSQKHGLPNDALLAHRNPPVLLPWI